MRGGEYISALRGATFATPPNRASDWVEATGREFAADGQRDG